MLEYSHAELLAIQYQNTSPSFNVDWWENHCKSLKTAGIQTYVIVVNTKSGKTIILEVVSNHIGFEG